MFHPVDKTLPDFQLKLVRFPVLQEGNVEAKIMERSISRLLLATYSNTVRSPLRGQHNLYSLWFRGFVSVYACC